MRRKTKKVFRKYFLEVYFMYYTNKDWDILDDYCSEEDTQRQFVFYMTMDRAVRNCGR